MDASDADAMPLPSEDTTPPVTKIREVMIGPFVESDILAAHARFRESPLCSPYTGRGRKTRRGRQGRTQDGRGPAERGRADAWPARDDRNPARQRRSGAG